jgi:Alpha amylase, catalytic domain
MPNGAIDDAEPWWKRGVLYQIYPLSFADSNGDGFGDLPGIIDHLDHLEWLGVDGLWLSPITVSPDADWGYDVVDYCAVQPEMGTLADLDRLVAEAAARGIRVLLGFVPNHTSDQHPWFVESRSWRGGGHLVVVNLTARGVAVPGAAGRIRIGTDRARDGASADAPLELQPWEAVVIEQ